MVDSLHEFAYKTLDERQHILQKPATIASQLVSSQLLAVNGQYTPRSSWGY